MKDSIYEPHTLDAFGPVSEPSDGEVAAVRRLINRFERDRSDGAWLLDALGLGGAA